MESNLGEGSVVARMPFIVGIEISQSLTKVLDAAAVSLHQARQLLYQGALGISDCTGANESFQHVVKLIRGFVVHTIYNDFPS